MHRTDLERAAQKLLVANAVTRAPIPVEDLAVSLKTDVRYSEGSDDVSGALIRNTDALVVAVNLAQHENRQRFTITHELGGRCITGRGVLAHGLGECLWSHGNVFIQSKSKTEWGNLRT